MFKGIILQPGAFDPIHRMHMRIANDAKKHFPGYFHAFILSMQTCDKGFIPAGEIRKRKNGIKEAGYRVVVTRSGLFINHIKRIRQEMKTIPIVFAVGEDTLYRFFRDWEAHYKGLGGGILRFATYALDFENVTWYVSKRTTPLEGEFGHLLEIYMKHHNNIIWSDLDLDDISSTQIRDEAARRAAHTMRLKDVQDGI